MWRRYAKDLYSCAIYTSRNWLGKQGWLNSGAIFAQPTLNLFGLMSLLPMKASGSFNALNVKLLAQRI
jgi:hypothetical protein